MRRKLLLILFVFSPLFATAQLATVPFVDLQKYAGTWYQIARNPLFFEGDCACSRQVLAPVPDGRVSVYNSCNDKTPQGLLREIRGFATSADTVSNSKFIVDFNLPQKGDYWIIGLDSNYQYAVVSDPKMRSLYILSKTPELNANLYVEAVQNAAQKLDVSKLVMTIQSGCTYPN